ncbi:MAG TPA: isocitrate lyase/phosphoenolpyruvate mutase family protein [Candidatus Acidoferrum sp.]|nr:isocitrate lyase/phosphoenolpyruvate mutase family protein [Candidatus Acidoferrum sp.]HXY79655.1 isocitrate lyase/phosphoenolpyruvate mutase family protein [Candidatus Bathyarchaeia archaeon]
MSVAQSEKAKKFRALHNLPTTPGAPIEPAARGTFIIPNPWDAGSARILAGLGFEALATTSAGFAFSLGRRDGGVTRDEVLAHCRSIVEATDLPVAADLENCFGDDPKIVAETIRLAAATGIVGGSVEDANGDDRDPIYDHSLAVERVAAAVEAARALPFPFTLTARAENFLHGRADLDDTIRRLQAYAEAGADVLFAPALPSLDAIRKVCAAVAPRPVNVLAGIKGLAFPVAELAAAGVRRISLGGSLSRLAFGALIGAAREMREKGTFTFVDRAAPTAEVAGFMLPKKNQAATS